MIRITIPKKPMGVGTIHDLESTEFERYIDIPDGHQFAVVPAAYYLIKECDFYETHKTLGCAVESALGGRLRNFSTTLIDHDGDVFCYDGSLVGHGYNSVNIDAADSVTSQVLCFGDYFFHETPLDQINQSPSSNVVYSSHRSISQRLIRAKRAETKVKVLGDWLRNWGGNQKGLLSDLGDALEKKDLFESRLLLNEINYDLDKRLSAVERVVSILSDAVKTDDGETKSES